MDFDYTLMPILLVLIALAIDAICVRSLVLLSGEPSGLRGKAIFTALSTCIVMLVVSFVAFWSAYNSIATHSFWAKHPPAGRFELVNGHRMYIQCTGSGSPTLVLDSGVGDDSVIWGQLQPVLSRTTRVCSYDRAGYGWSDAPSSPRDADHIANELHQLLHQAGVQGPIVLMGHSIAGVYSRDYAELYPSEIAGLILVDSSSPYQDRKSASRTTSWSPPSWLYHFAMIAGGARLLGMCSPHNGDPDAAFHTMRDEDICRLHFAMLSAEPANFDQSSAEVERSHSLGSIPILVFSRDPLGPLPRRVQTKNLLAAQNNWNDMQENLKSLSTRSRRVVVVGGTHHLFEERPDLVEKDVADFIEQIQGIIPPPSHYGTTGRE